MYCQLLPTFQHPFTSIIAGPTQSGKTTLVLKIIEYAGGIIEPMPDKILYCYAIWQNSYEFIKQKCPRVEFIKGLLKLDDLSASTKNLVIIDDLMESCNKNDDINSLFTRHSHHMNTSVVHITQNLFAQGKHSRTISLNCHYMIIMNNPRDRAQIFALSRQMYPTNPNFLMECYEDATKDKYGYLFLDLKPTSKYRVQSGVFPDEKRIIYIEKDDTSR